MKWTQVETDSFNALTGGPVLKFANPDLKYQVTSGASHAGTGAVQTQTDGKVLRPFAYTSKTFSETEQKYSTPEEELFGIIHALPTWRSYRRGAKIYNNDGSSPLKIFRYTKTIIKTAIQMRRIHAGIQLCNK